MVKIIITESAREKLKNLKLFYKKEPSRAETIISKIREGYNTLRRFPKAGAIEKIRSSYLMNFSNADQTIYLPLIYLSQ